MIENKNLVTGCPCKHNKKLIKSTNSSLSLVNDLWKAEQNVHLTQEIETILTRCNKAKFNHFMTKALESLIQTVGL